MSSSGGTPRRTRFARRRHELGTRNGIVWGGVLDTLSGPADTFGAF